jgi:hypothetical protein
MRNLKRSYRKVIASGLMMVSTPLLFAADIPEGGASNLPIREIALYKNGMAYFQRSGTVPAGKAAELNFKSPDMNDILKSLTVIDKNGGRVTAIRFDSNEPLNQKLNGYSIALGEAAPLSSFLDSVKGAQVELKFADRTETGTVMNARTVRNEAQNVVFGNQREQVVLLGNDGAIETIELSNVSSVKLLDPKLQQQLQGYLKTLDESRSKQTRSVFIDEGKSADRDLTVTYVAPTSIWKSSYRLILGAGQTTTLEGWAVVDNTSDEDWNNVRLSVVSGRPISFISPLDVARYAKRQVAELPDESAAAPVVYEGAVQNQEVGTAGVAGGSIGGVIGGVAPPPPAPGQTPQRMFTSSRLMAAKSSVEGAAGTPMGELFEYGFAQPVTIEKNQSAMLPFVQDRVTARKLLIYRDSDGEHPVNAAEVTNTTGKTLDGGPITVYDGGAYAGEALVETLKASDKRLIGYAVDYGTRVTTRYGSQDSTIKEIHASRGVLHVRTGLRQNRTYSAKNVDSKAKLMMIEYPAQPGFDVLQPSPAEKTASAYRFQMDLPANGTKALTIVTEQILDDTTVVSNASVDSLLVYVNNKTLSENGRRQLQKVIVLKKRLADLDSSLSTVNSQMQQLSEDEKRLRDNLNSLNKVSGQQDRVSKYAQQLADEDTKIVQLRDQISDLQQKRNATDMQLQQAAEQLDF